MKDKSLVLFYPQCIEFEAILAAQVIHGEELTIDVATPDGQDYRGPSGIALRATHSFAEVEPTEYRVIVIPGGDTNAVLEDKALIGILTTACDAGATFGAICAGPRLLAKAGLLKGRRFTHGFGVDSTFPEWEGGTYVDELVVADGRIVTAKPQAYIDFAIELLYAAGLRASWSEKHLLELGQLTDADTREVRIEAVKARYRAIWSSSQ